MSQSCCRLACATFVKNMATPLGRHRKYHSSSALSTIVDSPSSSRHKQGVAEPGNASLAYLPGLSSPSKPRRVKKEEDVQEWLDDLRSLRSSHRRRRAALEGLERALMGTCVRSGDHELTKFLNRNVHTPVLALLGRHVQQLTLLTSLPLPTDPDASLEHAQRLPQLILELETVIPLLQGLALLDSRAKGALSEMWCLEALIDLLLLLRTQPAMSRGRDSPPAIAYLIVDLLCCILVDAPPSIRAFERIGGLEAIVRLLKGTGVARPVRMKCIEFLYFYLQPEDVPRSTSSSSSGSSSPLFPPSPLSSSRSSSGASASQWQDLDVPFVPQTPSRKPQPLLGFLTPTANRVAQRSGSTSTPRKLGAVPEEPIPSSPRFGLGLGLPRNEHDLFAPKRSKSPLIQSSLPSDPCTPRKPKFPPAGIKSVQQKKEMLGVWLANVDDLVQGVDAIGFWGARK